MDFEHLKINLLQVSANWDDGDDIANAVRDAQFAKVEPVLTALCHMLSRIQSHLDELADAWQRGSLTEHDNLGGTRSTRNMDMLLAVKQTIAVAEGKTP